MSEVNRDYELLSFLGSRRIINRPTVRPIQNLQELNEVYRLTHDCYTENDYALPHPSGILIHYPYFDHTPQTTILIARLHGKVVGSASVTLDGPAGLTVDQDFHEVCDQARADGKRISAVWRLVVNQEHRGERQIVHRLILEASRILNKNQADLCYFAVNPKHVSVYERMLRMKVVARQAVTHGLSNAPSVLLCGDMQELPAMRLLRKPKAVLMPISSALRVSSFYF